MLTSDEQLSVDAERLAEVAQELFTMATRLQTRYPSSRILAATVDQFLEAALASGYSSSKAA
jgi:hypothetical protein